MFSGFQEVHPNDIYRGYDVKGSREVGQMSSNSKCLKAIE